MNYLKRVVPHPVKKRLIDAYFTHRGKVLSAAELHQIVYSYPLSTNERLRKARHETLNSAIRRLRNTTGIPIMYVPAKRGFWMQ